MCKNHGYRHADPRLVRVAALLGKDDEHIMEVMLRAALYTGLVSIRTGLEGITSHAVLAECDTLLDDVRDQTKDEARAAQVALITDWGYEVLAVLDEPPF